MIAKRQMPTADDSAKDIARMVTELRDVEESLIRAGLLDAHGALVLARGALASVGLRLRTDCRETSAALRAGREVPQ